MAERWSWWTEQHQKRAGVQLSTGRYPTVHVVDYGCMCACMQQQPESTDSASRASGTPTPSRSATYSVVLYIRSPRSPHLMHLRLLPQTVVSDVAAPYSPSPWCCWGSARPRPPCILGAPPVSPPFVTIRKQQSARRASPSPRTPCRHAPAPAVRQHLIHRSTT